MSQGTRNFDTLLESDELMSWLLFDFEGAIAPECMNSTEGTASLACADNTQFQSSAEVSSLKRSFAEFMSQDAANSEQSNSSDEETDNRKNGGSSQKSSKQVPSRKRSRESLDDLESKVKELQAENADLHAHLLNVTQRTTEVQRQRMEMERLMIAKLATLDDSNQEELAEIVKRYTDIYADYGKCRQREVWLFSYVHYFFFISKYTCIIMFYCINMVGVLSFATN